MKPGRKMGAVLWAQGNWERRERIELMMRLTQYPLSERMLKPTSCPAYYDELIKELDEAPHRSWFGRFINSWKGFIRFS